MAAHLHCLLTPPRWELHKEKQQRHNRIRYETNQPRMWCQHLLMLYSRLARKLAPFLNGRFVLFNMLSLAVRCRKCHGCVETQPCSSRSRENAPCAWRFAPDNILTFRNCSKGHHHQTGMRTDTKIGISASRTIYQPSRVGRKTAGPKRSVLHPTLRRQPCSGTQQSDNDDTLTLPFHFTHSRIPLCCADSSLQHQGYQNSR